MNVDRPTKLPFLEFLGWQMADVYRLTPIEMLASYERGWRYRQMGNPSASELAFIQQLVFTHQSWLSSEFMNFKIGHHQSILRVLRDLNSEFLSACQAYFGGGTLLALDMGEYRTSNDIDFVCAIGSGYRELRNRLDRESPQILLRPESNLQITRYHADQYGIRMAIEVDGVPIKTEIIAEARFTLDEPRQPSWSPVQCLSIHDCFVSKLLANADRYLDDGVCSRDLIDLAFLRNHHALPSGAIAKAETAYNVINPLTAAISRFQAYAERRFRCYEDLSIDPSFHAQLIDGIDLLALEMGLSKTTRTIGESGDEIFPFS
jgi:Nucleotidyl transferase AbiEii toxin, Type IV TA system